MIAKIYKHLMTLLMKKNIEKKKLTAFWDLEPVSMRS